jgi:hypothetical protein
MENKGGSVPSNLFDDGGEEYSYKLFDLDNLIKAHEELEAIKQLLGSISSIKIDLNFDKLYEELKKIKQEFSDTTEEINGKNRKQKNKNTQQNDNKTEDVDTNINDNKKNESKTDNTGSENFNIPKDIEDFLDKNYKEAKELFKKFKNNFSIGENDLFTKHIKNLRDIGGIDEEISTQGDIDKNKNFIQKSISNVRKGLRFLNFNSPSDMFKNLGAEALKWIGSEGEHNFSLDKVLRKQNIPKSRMEQLQEKRNLLQNEQDEIGKRFRIKGQDFLKKFVSDKSNDNSPNKTSSVEKKASEKGLGLLGVGSDSHILSEIYKTLNNFKRDVNDKLKEIIGILRNGKNYKNDNKNKKGFFDDILSKISDGIGTALGFAGTGFVGKVFSKVIGIGGADTTAATTAPVVDSTVAGGITLTGIASILGGMAILGGLIWEGLKTYHEFENNNDKHTNIKNIIDTNKILEKHKNNLILQKNNNDVNPEKHKSWWPFASGGIVTSPTHALIGESGPEAVIPLNSQNHTFIKSLERYVSNSSDSSNNIVKQNVNSFNINFVINNPIVRSEDDVKEYISRVFEARMESFLNERFNNVRYV